MFFNIFLDILLLPRVPGEQGVLDQRVLLELPDRVLRRERGWGEHADGCCGVVSLQKWFALVLTEKNVVLTLQN